MPWTQNNIYRRESILANLLNYSQDLVLNSSKKRVDLLAHIPLAAQLKMAVNQFKASAMNESGTSVNYQLIAKSDAYQHFLEQCTPQLHHFDPNNLATRADRLAFWINLYNVLVIDAVIQFNVENSVTEGFAGILKFFRRSAYLIHKHRVSLEDIEHGILRGNSGNPYIPGPQFGEGDPRLGWVITPVDPRIHFAINCASRSCPAIGVYSPEAIDSQLNLAANNFIRQETHLDSDHQIIATSQILNWFKDDFGGKRGVIDFIYQYLPKDQDDMQFNDPNKIKLKFRRYDWHLNI